MQTATDEHPSLAALIACGQGRLSAPEQRAIEDHVQQCDRCVQALWTKKESSQLSLVQTPIPPMLTIPWELRDHPRYRILGPLGAGGMGVVFKAEHRIMGRTVALKVMAQRYLTNPDAIERFQREVRAAAKLSHPNIVTAHDADSAGGQHFLVMEYVEGVSLDRVVAKRGQQSIAVACQCIRQAAQGLQHASTFGMVHRDIKPHNLMVTRKGQIKILDFGLARFVFESDTSTELAALPPGLIASDAMTSASMVIGTPDYLAPEQARCSKDVDIRADIYGLGCTLYFLLAGRAPFADIPSAFEKMLAHADVEPPKIEDLRGDIPAGLVAILEKMLAKNPDDRYSCPSEVAAALHAFTRAGVVLEAEPVEVEVVPPVPIAEAPTVPLRRKPKRHKRKKPKRIPRKNWLAFGGGVLAVLCAVSLGLGLAKAINRKAIAAEPSKPAVVKSNKVLIVLPNNGMNFAEYSSVREGLRNRGFNCTIAAKNKALCHPFRIGPAVMADLSLGDVVPSDYDAVVFIGQNVNDYLNVPEGSPVAVKKIIDAMLADSKPIAGIGLGQMPLVIHRLLDNRPAAGNWDVQNQVSKSTVQWQADQHVVESGTVFTASGAGDGDALAKLLADRLKGK